MKQIIYKRKDDSISDKYYLNHLNQLNGITISYWYNGNLFRKTNYVNGKRFGLGTDYNNNNKPKVITYNL